MLQRILKVSDTLKLVKQLRELTGAGMMDCKKYLEKSNNNIDDAIKLLDQSQEKKQKKKVRESLLMAL